MRIAVFTDTHITADGRRIFGVDPSARLANCIAQINAFRPDLCVALGDMVEEATPGAYESLSRLLEAIEAPLRVLPGNHDDRTMLAQALPGATRETAGFLQSAMDTPDGVLFFLDTTEPGTHAGRYCAARQAWLAKCLAEAGKKPAIIFMHHAPILFGMRVDRAPLLDADAFGNIVTAAGNVRHIFFGHTHRGASGTWRGIGWTNLHGTAVQSDLRLTTEEVGRVAGPAQFGIAELQLGDIALHIVGFSESLPVLQVDR